jgi:hypothetical protein
LVQDTASEGSADDGEDALEEAHHAAHAPIDDSKYDPANNHPLLANAEPDIDVPDPVYRFETYHHISNNRLFQAKLMLNIHSHVPSEMSTATK